jgi:twinkle protein
MFNELHKAGFSVIPTKDKKPLIKSWAEYQKRQPTDKEHSEMDFSHGGSVICSGDVFCIDLDTKNDKTGLVNRWKNLVSFFDDKLLKKLYCESTPSGGFHLVFRCDVDNGNEQWAYDKDQKSPCIETRAKGGYFVTAPSEGYKSLKGNILDLPKISLDEFEILKNSALDLDEKKKIVEYIPKIEKEGITPLDDYDSQHGEQDMVDMLLQYGWRVSGRQGQKTYLCRPDKSKGVSATVGAVPNRLYVFTSSTEFEPQKTYKPSAVLCMLEHGGDFRECAKFLSNQGYGVKKPVASLGKAKIAVYSEMAEEMFRHAKGDFPTGNLTGFNCLDEFYRISDHQLTVVTGISSHGKSTFLNHLMVNQAKLHGWRFLVYSPESYPIAIHFRSLCQMYLRENIFGNSKENILRAVSFVEKHFVFVDCGEEDITLASVLNLAKEQKVNGLIIDPWNDIDWERPSTMNETDYVKLCLKKMRMASRSSKFHTFLVAHPTKLMKDKNGVYPVPTPFDIQGSSAFYSKPDNCLSVYINEAGEIEVHVQKIKVQYYGKKGLAKLKFDKTFYGYVDPISKDEKDLWDNGRMK